MQVQGTPPPFWFYSDYYVGSGLKWTRFTGGWLFDFIDIKIALELFDFIVIVFDKQVGLWWFADVCICLLYMFVIVCLIYINIYLYDYLSIAHHFHFAQKLAWPRGRVRWLQHPAVSLSTILMSMMLVISKKNMMKNQQVRRKKFSISSAAQVCNCAQYLWIPLDISAIKSGTQASPIIRKL